jgi:hypothetical protein
VMVGIIFRVNYFNIINVVANTGSSLVGSLFGGFGIFDYIQSLIGIFILSLFLMFVGDTFIMWGAAAIIGGRRVTFLYSLLASFARYVILLLLTLIFSRMNNAVSMLVLIIISSIFLIALILKLIYGTTYWPGLFITLISWGATILSTVLVVAIAISGLVDSLSTLANSIPFF